MDNATKMLNMIIEAYVQVYGIEKWDSLTAEQQHNAVMIIAKDFTRALDRI